jgi:hypothetical protein
MRSEADRWKAGPATAGVTHAQDVSPGCRTMPELWQKTE